MTLCLAWKTNDEVFFVSDSRLTGLNNEVRSDDSPKVFKINVEIYNATNELSEEEPLLHQTSFGLCFAGDYLNGSILADTIEEILSNIQATPLSDTSINNLTDIAFAVYKQVSRQLMQIHSSRSLTTVLLGGYCPETNEFKLYRFSPLPVIAGQLVDFAKEEVALGDDTIIIGDSAAETKARRLLNNLDENYTHFHVLRDIIRDHTSETVGGGIQAGLFRVNKFKTFGIMEYEVFNGDNGDSELRQSFRFRNLSLDFDDNELRTGNLNILKTFFNPFEHERQAYFKEVVGDLLENQ